VQAVWIRLRAELGTRWRAWLTLAALAGLAGGLVIATAAAARRADSAIDRWRDVTEVMDVWVGKGELWGLDIEFSRVERLPQVAGATRSIDPVYWARTDAGRTVTVNDTELNVATNGPHGNAKRAKMLEGRLRDPTRVDEINVGSGAAERHGLRVGSTLRVRFATRQEVAKVVAGGELDPRADPETAGEGPLLTMRVVGVMAEIQSDDTLGFIELSPAFYKAYGRNLGVWTAFTGVWLKRGDADLEAFRAGVERIAGDRPIGFYPKKTLVAKLRSSIHLQAQALWILAALSALAALALVGQAVARQTALDSIEHRVLQSLGMTRRQLLALGLLRVLPVGVVAGVLAVALAAALSPLAPIGVARTAEPDPGVSLDLLLLAVGGGATAAVVILAALVPARRAARPARATRAALRRSAAADRLARSGLSPSTVAGVRMALEPGQTAVPVRSTLVSAIVGVAALMTALTITASADRLLGTPRLYGQNWDAVIGDASYPTFPSRFFAELRGDRSISELAIGTAEEARVGGEPMWLLATDPIRGTLSPTVLEGRAPAARGEILLGTKTAQALRVDVGDEVKGRIGDRVRALRVVGRGVLPDLGVTGGGTLALGNGGAMTYSGLRELDPNALRNTVLLNVAPGPRGDATLARLRREASAVVPRRPSEVANWGRVSGFPYLIAALVAAAAAAALAHALVTSIRRRRQDLAVLKTLGFERRDVRKTVAWQATTVAAIGVLVGLPLGMAIGRFAWNLFATGLGVVPETAIPIAPALLIVPATILIANLIALLPAAIAARTQPAVVLRAE
jgi:FtsX-like permease family